MRFLFGACLESQRACTQCRSCKEPARPLRPGARSAGTGFHSPHAQAARRRLWRRSDEQQHHVREDAENQLIDPRIIVPTAGNALCNKVLERSDDRAVRLGGHPLQQLRAARGPSALRRLVGALGGGAGEGAGDSFQEAGRMAERPSPAHLDLVRNRRRIHGLVAAEHCRYRLRNQEKKGGGKACASGDGEASRVSISRKAEAAC